MWNVARSYSISPSEAWRELGRPALSPRQRRRLTLASLELAHLDQAFESIPQTLKAGKAPRSEDVLLVRDAERLYNEARQPVWDRIAEECTLAEAEAGTLPEGAAVAPFTGDDTTATEPDTQEPEGAV